MRKMNISISHPVPTFGDSFTVTCYVCGMPSSKEWAQRTRSRPSSPLKPFYPFLLQITPQGGAMLREDGSTFLCAFCHASLEAQWLAYESQQVVPPPNRKYNTQKFICAVCGVETYRKRIRALPFQEFPFLEKQRQTGSITLGNNPLAVVCLDCSETLWAQSAEYDRWGLPVHKRHFNWMARPPPPENSVEATVARLPSGETQLPRCPPIEPAVVPMKVIEPPASVKLPEPPVTSKGRIKGKGDSPKLEHMTPQQLAVASSSRKTSMSSTTPPALDVSGFHSQQPPVVTVAPMSSHTSVVSLRKNSLGIPPGLISHSSTHPVQLSSAGIFPHPVVFSSSAPYAPYVWSGASREEVGQRSLESYPYPSTSDSVAGASVAWPWLSPSSSDLLRYQTYVSSLQGRPLISEASGSTSGSPTHTPAPPTGRSYLPSGTSSSFPRVTSPSTSREVTATVTSGGLAKHRESSGGSEHHAYHQSSSSTKDSLERKSSRFHSGSSSHRSHSSSHPKKMGRSVSPEETMTEQKPSNSPPHSSTVKSGGEPSAGPSHAAASGGESVQGAPREFHIPKKRNWQVFMTESSNASTSQGGEAHRSKRSPEMMHHPKKKRATTTSECSTSELSSRNEPVKHHHHRRSSSECENNNGSRREKVSTTPPRQLGDSAMDLSVVPPPPNLNKAKRGEARSRSFLIENLCKSEPRQSSGEDNTDDDAASPVADDSATSRTSVIKCVPKPLSSETSQKSEDEEMEEGEEDKKEEKVEEDKDLSVRKERRGSECPHPKKRQCATSVTATAAADSGGESAAPVKAEESHVAAAVVDAPSTDEGAPSASDDDEQKREGKTEESDSEGNSESNPQDSEFHENENDDRKNEGLPNIQQFIKETITDLVIREKTEKAKRRRAVDKQKQFLQTLGLVTPDQRIALEIKSIVRRHESKTLPPLKLRVATSQAKKIDRQLHDLLVKVALEDTSFLDEPPSLDVHKSEFMATLGLRAADKSEKALRDVKWKMILIERIQRELRDARARGLKHEWEKSEAFKRLAKCDLDAFFTSLSNRAKEVVATEESSGSVNNTSDRESDTSSDKSLSGVCINYPKYIPSYAAAGSSKDQSPDRLNSTFPEMDPDQQQSLPQRIAIEPILKIPVIASAQRRRQPDSSSSASISDSDDSVEPVSQEMASVGDASVFKLPSFPPPGAPYSPDQLPQRVDTLIHYSRNSWEHVKRTIDDILTDLDNSKEDLLPLESRVSHVEKLRKHLKAQQSDMKVLEKRLRQAAGSIFTSSKRRKTSPIAE